ncbi:MAG: hypothetical protein U0930_20005, partial [Pirellulales bacterium]
SLLTLADIAKINDVSVRDMGATDIFNRAPFISAIAVQEASHGTEHKYVKETGAPTVGFRAPNTGRSRSKSGDTSVTETLKYLDCAFHMDKAIAGSNPKGVDYVMAREGRRHLRAGFAAAERQIFDGTGSDALGYAGLRDNAGLNGLNDAMVINAGYTTAGQPKNDVWLIRVDMDTDVCLLIGNGGNLKIDPYYEQAVTDGSGNLFQAFVQDCSAWLGLQIAGAKSIARICNINANAGATANILTDSLLEQAFELFPSEAPPTHIVTHRRMVSQLKRSRTATRADGQAAPRPEDYEGIPIVMTDNLTTYTTAIA